MEQQRNWVAESNKMVEDGLLGLNKGYEYRLSVLNKYLNIVPSTYYLYAALSNVGKSSFVYDQHIYNMLDMYLKKKDFDIHIDIYTPEISPATILGKGRCYWLYKTKGILITTNLLFSKHGLKLPLRIKDLVFSKECNAFIELLAEKITFYPYLTTTNIKTNTFKYLRNNGEVTIIDGNIIKYTPTNKAKIYQIIIDHIGSITTTGRQTLKSAIDEVSKFLYASRIPTKLIAVVLQQINPEKAYTAEQSVLPSHQDLRDSKNPYQDADIYISIGNPYKHDLGSYLGYKIIPSRTATVALKNRFRVLRIAKNRDGDINKLIPVLFIGEVGVYADIKLPNETNYNKINNICALKT